MKSAIGYDKARGDQVEVVNMPFARMDVGPVAPAPEPFLGLDSAYWFKIIEAAILSLTALLIGLFVVRPLIRSMFAPVPAGGHAPARSPASRRTTCRRRTAEAAKAARPRSPPTARPRRCPAPRMAP